MLRMIRIMTDADTQANDDEAPLRPGNDEWRQRFEDIARTITGKDAPLWLVESFVAFEPWIGDDNCAAETLGNRAEARKRLKEIKDAASAILRAVDDSGFRSFLEGPSLGEIDFRLGLLLKDLICRVNKSDARLVSKGAKTKAGRGSAKPPDYLPPKTICAAMIAEAWSIVRGKEPGSRNQQAALAAQLLWIKHPNGLRLKETNLPNIKVVPVDARSWSDRPLSGWRRYFEDAKSPDAASWRRKFRHYLIESKHCEEQFAQAGAANESA
jgi:hypothetical protein